MSRMSRRRFVQGSLAAAASVAAVPGFLRSEEANEKLGVAVVGTRGRGSSHLGAYMGDQRTAVVALVEVDKDVAKQRSAQVASKQGFAPKVYTDLRDAFNDKNVDMVSTATPNHWHALCGVWAMQAGKDVYIEKPICHEIAEGSALIAAARKYERMCQVGTQCRSNPAIQNAMKFLHEGGIGEVKLARALCYKRRKSIGPLGDYPIPSSIDFNLWSGPATYTDPKLTRGQFHYDWHWQRHYGNGDSGNQGPHQTDIARWGLGVTTHPTSVIAYGGRLGYQAERKNPNYVDAGDTANTEVGIYDFGDKTIVFETRGLSVNGCADDELNRLFQSDKGNKIGVVFYGSEGYLVQRSYTDCIAYDKNMKEIKKFGGGGNHFGNFIDACVSRDYSSLNSDAREGHLSAAISHLANISYYLGEKNKVPASEAKKVLAGIKSHDDNAATLERTIQHLVDNEVDLDKYPIAVGPLLKFDPEAEVFPDSPEATKLITREYRDEFVCPRAEEV